MSVFEIYKEAINAGGYSISAMEERIETVYACGKITKEERAELLSMTAEKGDTLTIAEIMDKLAEVDVRLLRLESVEITTWVSGMVTAKGQTVLYDIDGDGVLDRVRYDGGRASTSSRPGKIEGWVVVDGNGTATHRITKDENGNIILVPIEE